jgi:5-methylcytosine-specific restriction endonuclease McrA
MPGIFKLPGQKSTNGVKMSFGTFEKKCDVCGLFLKEIDFYKNRAKATGLHNYCKICMKEHKKRKRLLKKVVIRQDLFFIPDIYLVGYGRCQTYQVCCLSCEKGFFCMNDVKNFSDLLCDDCQDREITLPERNTSKTNFVGNIVGWLAKIVCTVKIRGSRNYKKCYERDRYTCQYCGYNLKNSPKFLPLHIDHIKPWSAQGGNGLNNLVVSCQECNLIASDKWFTCFEEKKEYIILQRRQKKID